MKSGRRTFVPVVYLIIGMVLLILGCTGVVDEFWNGMGCGLIAVGILRMVRLFRFHKDDTYREKVEIEMTDERNRFIRGKAWSWAGYLFILVSGISVIVLKIAGQDLLSMAASCAVCLMLILYWAAYLILRKKY